MEVSQQGLALIKKYEGFSAKPYRCPAGKLTIGYGHVIGAEESFPAAIDEAAAHALLVRDVGSFARAVLLLTGPLAQHRLDALVSLAYNIGIKAFEKSTLLGYLQRGMQIEAAGEFERWVYTGKRRLPGLLARRKAEKTLFLSCLTTD